MGAETDGGAVPVLQHADTLLNMPYFITDSDGMLADLKKCYIRVLLLCKQTKRPSVSRETFIVHTKMGCEFKEIQWSH